MFWQHGYLLNAIEPDDDVVCATYVVSWRANKTTLSALIWLRADAWSLEQSQKNVSLRC